MKLNSTFFHKWKILRYFNSKLSTAAIYLAASSLISRVLGIIRDHLLAKQFGAGSLLDAYQISFIIPDLIFNLFLIGAISAAFIPIFSGLIHKKKEAWRLVNTVLTVSAIFMVFAIGLVFLIVPFITQVFHNLSYLTGENYIPQHSALVVNLTRLLLLSPLLLGISTIFTSILHSFKHFILPALSPIFYNLGIILGILFLVPLFGIYGVVLGVILGAFLHLLIQYPALKIVGWHYKFALHISKAFKKVILLTIPRALSLIANQASFWVNKITAFSLGNGSLSAYYFAHNLQYLAIGLCGISLATASFPSLALNSNHRNKRKFIHTLCLTMRTILFFTIPLSFIFFLLKENIVRLILGSGRFDWEDTFITAQTLGYFSISIFAQSGTLLLARAFYALRDTKTPLFVNLTTLCINLTLALWWVKILGTAGLALAFSVASLISFFALYILLHIYYQSLHHHLLLKSGFLIVFASLISALSIYYTAPFLSVAINTNTGIGLLVETSILLSLATLVYLGIHILLKSEDLSLVLERIRKILLRTSNPAN